MAQWTKKWKACRRSEVRTRVGKIHFCNNTENAVKINNSPRFTAFTAKRCKKYAVKIIFFHRISPHFLRKFTAKPRPGWDTKLFVTKRILWWKMKKKSFDTKKVHSGGIIPEQSALFVFNSWGKRKRMNQL